MTFFFSRKHKPLIIKLPANSKNHQKRTLWSSLNVTDYLKSSLVIRLVVRCKIYPRYCWEWVCLPVGTYRRQGGYDRELPDLDACIGGRGDPPCLSLAPLQHKNRIHINF